MTELLPEKAISGMRKLQVNKYTIMKKLVFILIMLITLTSNAQFCNKYADKAVAQYKLAKTNNLSGISWPLWTDDWNKHFNWCKKVPEDIANKQNAFREAYLKKYITKKKNQTKEDFCNNYADKALKQYTQAVQLHLPDMNPLLWNNNRELHIKWCMAVPENTATQENNKRQKLIDNYSNSTQKQPKQDPHKETGYKYIEIAETPDFTPLIGLKEKICSHYAKESIRLIKLNRSKRCHFNLLCYYDPDIFDEYECFKSWCMDDANYFEAEKALNEKIEKLKACRGINTIWVPGMVIGLRHSLNNENDVFIPSKDYFDWQKMKHDENFSKYHINSTWDIEDVSNIPKYPPKWEFYTVRDGDFPEANQYNLPPGIVINLKGRETLFIAEFGFKQEDILYSSYLNEPEYYGEGKFHKEIGGDLGDKPGSGLSWYESTGLGFKDWSQINNLPRGTVIGLKHSLNQPNKKLTWQGVVYDPADPNIKPPPGFARKAGGDPEAPVGEGYFWYEKITGK
jgi:hypothetical protein